MVGGASLPALPSLEVWAQVHLILAEPPPSLWDFFFFWQLHLACGILVPRPGIEPPAVEAQSPNHWTTREFPSPSPSLRLSLR